MRCDNRTAARWCTEILFETCIPRRTLLIYSGRPLNTGFSLTLLKSRFETFSKFYKFRLFRSMGGYRISCGSDHNRNKTHFLRKFVVRRCSDDLFCYFQFVVAFSKEGRQNTFLSETLSTSWALSRSFLEKGITTIPPLKPSLVSGPWLLIVKISSQTGRFQYIFNFHRVNRSRNVKRISYLALGSEPYSFIFSNGFVSTGSNDCSTSVVRGQLIVFWGSYIFSSQPCFCRVRISARDSKRYW